MQRMNGLLIFEVKATRNSAPIPKCTANLRRVSRRDGLLKRGRCIRLLVLPTISVGARSLEWIRDASFREWLSTHPSISTTRLRRTPSTVCLRVRITEPIAARSLCSEICDRSMVDAEFEEHFYYRPDLPSRYPLKTRDSGYTVLLECVLY